MAVMALPMSRTHLPSWLLRLTEGEGGGFSQSEHPRPRSAARSPTMAVSSPYRGHWRRERERERETQPPSGWTWGSDQALSLRAAPMPPREQKKHSQPSQNPGGGITLKFTRLHLILHDIQPVRAGLGVNTLRTNTETAAKRKSSREPRAPPAVGHTSTGACKNRTTF